MLPYFSPLTGREPHASLCVPSASHVTVQVPDQLPLVLKKKKKSPFLSAFEQVSWQEIEFLSISELLCTIYSINLQKIPCELQH